MRRVLRRLRRLARAMPSIRDVPGFRSGGWRGRLAREFGAPGTHRAVIVLAVDGDAWREVTRWRRLFADARLVVFSNGLRPRADGVEVRPFEGAVAVETSAHSLPAPDIIADLRTAKPESVVWLWRRLFFLVREGGVYVSRGIDPLETWRAVVPRAADSDAVPRDIGELTGSAERVPLGRAVTVLAKRRRHLLRVTERLADVLPTRDPGLERSVEQTLPPTAFASRAHTVSHESSVRIAMPDEFDIPELTAMRYRGDLHHAGEQVLWQDHSVLPPSITVNEVAVVRNAANFGDMVRLPERYMTDTARLDGAFYDLNVAWLGHFGHFMTEVPAKLWAWREAKAADPALKAIFPLKPDYEPILERRLLAAYGLTDGDIQWTRSTVRLSSYLSAQPLFRNTGDIFIHPRIADVWNELRDALADRDAPTPERIFVTRPARLVHRPCRNADDVESLFARNGYAIVSPETMTLEQQATLFANARVVAGFGGSALFNLIFADRLESLIVLNHESYTARNEHLMSAVRGGAAHFFWSPADMPQPDGRFSDTAFHSGWEFDFARNGTALRAALADT